MFLLSILGFSFFALILCGEEDVKADPSFSGPTFQNQGRSAKLSQIWAAVARDRTPLKWYSALQLGELFIESMNTTFSEPRDDMPNQYIGGFFARKKLVHTVGPILLGRYNPVKNPFNYSGIFRSGSDSAIIRFSAAAEPKESPESLTPGLSIKFLRDKVPSGNAFAMFNLMGQPSFNFYKHDLSNHPPDLGDWAPLTLKALKVRFSTGSSWPTMLGLSDIARFDQFGNQQSPVSFPYRLVFHPNKRLHESLPDNYLGPFEKQVIHVTNKANETIYTVWAQDTPASTTLVQIGELVSTTPATGSNFGDKSLFFQHTSFESDLRLKPQWAPLADAERTKQRGIVGYNYQDLPW